MTTVATRNDPRLAIIQQLGYTHIENQRNYFEFEKPITHGQKDSDGCFPSFHLQFDGDVVMVSIAAYSEKRQTIVIRVTEYFVTQEELEAKIQRAEASVLAAWNMMAGMKYHV